MSTADRLRGGRSIAARGHLSLDREKAREKLRMFRLPDPHYYVLQFVRAASVLGARAIEFDISATQMTCWFDKELAPELLEDIWGVAFDARTDAAGHAAHYVALGIGSAQALNPSVITVQSGDVKLTFRDETESLSRGGVHSGTTIWVKEKFRFGHLMEFFTSIAGKLPEVIALEQRCAFARIDVQINNRTNRKLTHELANHQVTFSEQHERGFVALETVSVDGWCEVLKDGVALSRIRIANHGRAAIGAMESDRVQADLSGLSLIEVAGWDAGVHDVFIPHYHQALTEWLRTIPRDDVADKLDMLAELADYARARDGELHEVTRELIDKLCDMPLFENALEHPGPPTLSIDDVTWPALARYSKERFPDLKTRDGRPVLLAEPSATGGLVDVRVRMLRESALIALASSRVRDTLDVTHELDRQATAQRNEALWRARPPHEIGGHRYQRTVEVGPRRGVLHLPLETPDRAISYDARGFFAYRDGRLVRRNEGDVAIAIEVDGHLGVNMRHDDIIRDQGFTSLAVQLCAMSLELHQEFAEDILRTGRSERARPRLLDHFVLSLCKGDWCREFFTLVGYLPATQVPTLLEEHAEALAHLTWFDEQRRAEDVVERLGPIARVPSIELADGRFCSLVEALENDALCLLQPTGDWRAFLARVRRQQSRDVLGDIAVVDGAQEALLRRLRPVADARLAVERIRAREQYFQREKYGSRHPGKIALEVVERGPWFSATIMLVPGGTPGVCDTTFVWQSRELGTRRFEVPMGSFVAEVYSSEFTPTDDYSDVRSDQRVKAVEEFVADKTSAMLDTWWTQAHAKGLPGPGAEFDLFVDVAHELAPRHPDRALIPVAVRKNGHWVSEMVSQKSLRSTASRHGLVLSFTRTDRADENLLADPQAPVIRLGSRREESELMTLVGPGLRLVDASPVGLATRVPPKTFWEKSTRSHGVDGAAFEWQGVVRGLTCHCGLYHDPNADPDPDAQRIDVTTATAAELQQLHGIGPTLASAIILFRAHQELEKPEDLLRVAGIGPATFEDIKNSIRVGGSERTSRTSNLVSVLAQRRLLESLDIETPMGKFRTTMSGEAIVPDPTYTFAAGGRDKILIAAHEVAAKTIREACQQARETGTPVLELVPDLRRFLAICKSTPMRPPFDLDEVLAATPLFPTLAGRWLSLMQFGELLQDRVLPWSSDGNRADVLRLARHELEVVQSIVGPAIELREEASSWVESPPARLVVEGDPILDTVVDLLIASREDRIDLFDDHLAQRVRWSPVLTKSLCRVSRDGVDVNPAHAVVAAVRAHGDIGACAFLASTIYSAINAYYREITDHDELELQSRLVGAIDG